MQGDHYMGLVAEWYDDWLSSRHDDVESYASYFSGFQGTALELDCGTGRILLPIAKSGVDIHGLDGSKDMLRILKVKADKAGLSDIQVHRQPMESFEIGLQFDAIFVTSGSFQLLTDPDAIAGSLRCIFRHLRQGGSFVADIFIPRDEIAQSESNVYRVTRDNVRANGDRSVVHERFSINIERQLKLGTYRYEFYSDRRLTTCIMDDLNIRWYWKDEFIELLTAAGFGDIQLLTDFPLYHEDYSFVFKATK
jgi:SAM-dependent methyltransferase